MESGRRQKETRGPVYERKDGPTVDLNFQHRHKIVSVYVQYLRGDTETTDVEFIRKNTLKNEYHFIDGMYPLSAKNEEQRVYERQNARKMLLQRAEQMIDKILEQAFGDE